MPIAEDVELETVAPEEPVDRDELARLENWHWEMRTFTDSSPGEDWFWAEEERRRLRLAAGEEPQEE